MWPLILKLLLKIIVSEEIRVTPCPKLRPRGGYSLWSREGVIGSDREYPAREHRRSNVD